MRYSISISHRTLTNDHRPLIYLHLQSSKWPTAERLIRFRCSFQYSFDDGIRIHTLSLAFEVTLQPVEKSFTDSEIGEISARIVAAAEKLGARLRS